MLAYFVIFISGPVVDWCEKWKWNWENQWRCNMV